MKKNIIIYFVIIILLILISTSSIKNSREIKQYLNMNVESNSEICNNNELTEEDKYYCEALDKNIKQGSFFYYYSYLLSTGINKIIIGFICCFKSMSLKLSFFIYFGK